MSGNVELENRLQSENNIIKNKNQIIDKDLFNQRTQTLLEVTRGAFKDTFTLDRIRAAIHNYK